MVSLLASATILTTTFVIVNTDGEDTKLKRAQKAVSYCADTEIECFTKSFKIIYKYGSMSGVIDTLESQIKTRGNKWDCHTMSHHVGEDMYLIDGMKSVQSGAENLCVSGLYDGMFTGLGQRVEIKNLYKAGIELCAKIKMSQYSCLHGLGHAVAVTTKGDIKKSLEICDMIQNELTARNCGLGVLMQLNPISLGTISPCVGELSPAFSGCANIFSLILVRNNIPMNIGCALHVGYVKDDCEYGYGWWSSSTYYKEGKTARSTCNDSSWCSRGWGWGATIARPQSAEVECNQSYESNKKLLRVCLLGTTQDFLHDSVLPDKPSPLESADALSDVPNVEDITPSK